MAAASSASPSLRRRPRGEPRSLERRAESATGIGSSLIDENSERSGARRATPSENTADSSAGCQPALHRHAAEKVGRPGAALQVQLSDANAVDESAENHERRPRKSCPPG